MSPGSRFRLDAALRLGRASADPGDVQVSEHAPHLGGQRLAGELLFQCHRFLRSGLEDLVTVAVEGKRHAAPAHHLTQEQEVTLGVFLFPEDGERNVAGGVIDRPHESEPGSVWAQPLVAAAVNLKHPGLGHSLAARAVARRSPPLRTAPSGRSQDALHRGAAQRYPFPLGQQLRQVLVVAACVDALSQLDDALADANIRSMHRLPAPVAVHQGSGSVSRERVSQASLVPLRQAHQFRRLAGGPPPVYDRC